MTTTPTLRIVILSYNRAPALARTLRELHALGAPGPLRLAPDILTQVVVVDNASHDASVEMVHERFPEVRVLALPENLGVAGFQRGVSECEAEFVLLLDDDAWPEDAALVGALRALAGDAHCAGVALLPVHPQSRVVEWPFATRPTKDFPVMGCGNIIRTSAWDRVGGYEESFFLYRNDVDLALKFLGMGWGVEFDPAWRVWHDSPAASHKSERWLRLATRNWIWMCRRHGGDAITIGLVGWAGVVWALRQAGWSLRRWNAVLVGIRESLTEVCPPWNPPLRLGAGLRRLLAMRLGI